MRAIRVERDGSVAVVDAPRPVPGPEDVILQVLASGVCRSDLHVREEVRTGERAPLIPGHEIAGRVVERGPDVYRVNVGDVVVVNFDQPCGRCRHCRRKRANLCQNGGSLGFTADGGHAEFARARQDTVLAVPRGLEPALVAPLGCSGGTAHQAVVGLGRVGDADVAAMIGAGGVGLSAIQIAKANGARVVAVDLREDALRAAREVGADAAARPSDARAAVDSLSEGDGADLVADFVGSRDSLELGRALLGVGGRLVVVAPGTERISMSANDLVDGGRSYLGTYGYTMADLGRVVSLAEAGLLRPVVTRREPLVRAGEVMEDLASGKIIGRAVLDPLRS